ncbi:MAG: hypothetical protein ACWA41_11000 [Putridiphycobacter sp.]
MKKTNHISSFTLINVLVGMTISSILISFVYTIYTNLSQITIQYQKTHLHLNDYNLAIADLNRNIEGAKTIISYPKGFKIQTHNQDEIIYFKDNHHLIKKTKRGETTIFKNIEQIKTLKYSPLSSGMDELELIHQVQIDFNIEGQIFSTYYFNNLDSRKKLNALLIHD